MGETDQLTFLSEGGLMGSLMRTHDWTTSALGPPARWPQSLRTVVRIMLNTGHPMYVFWGPQLCCLYNDAYSESIGPERHPGSLGRPAREVWEEIWDIIGPQIEQVMAGDGHTWHENQLVPITRHVGPWMFGGVAVFGVATIGFVVIDEVTLPPALAARRITNPDAPRLDVALRHALIRAPEVAPYLRPERLASAADGLQNPVVFKNYALESITELRLGGRRYRVRAEKGV